MDYKKLANLLYPDAVDANVWIEKFPKRNLPQGAEVTRFAPSPTGSLHIGHFFQSLCDMYIAKTTGGIFYFRIEDTDKKREIAGSVDAAIDTLNAFGINYDEGVIKGGEEKGAYGPYTQSKREEIYKSFAKLLVEKGRAYPCFCAKTEGIEEIEENRQKQLQNNEDLTGKDACRELSYEEIEQFVKAGKPFALRLKSTGDPEKSFAFTDEVKGQREIRENAKDIILIKSNGLPVYAFAHAVDDSLMGTTLVIRGEEWYASLASHLEVFDALGFERVKYAHNPVICKLDENGNKRKLSKRKDKEFDVKYFITSGYPTGAIIEYLLNLANSNFEIWRRENPSAPVEEFNFSARKISSSNPIFDLAKLNDISKTIISKMTKEEVCEHFEKWLTNFDKATEEYAKNAILLEDKEYFKNVVNIDRETPKPRKDIVKWEDVINVWGYMFDKVFDKFSISDYELDQTNLNNLKEVLESYENEFDIRDTKDEWFNRIKAMSERLGYATDNKLYKANPEQYKGNTALVCEYIRLALTGRKNSPDLYSIMNVLGAEKCKARMQKAQVLLRQSCK